MSHRGGGGSGHCRRLPRTLENCLSSTSPLILLLLVILLNWTNAAYALGRVSWVTGWPVKSANTFCWLELWIPNVFLGNAELAWHWYNMVTPDSWWDTLQLVSEVARSPHRTLQKAPETAAHTLPSVFTVLLQYLHTTLKYLSILALLGNKGCKKGDLVQDYDRTIFYLMLPYIMLL